jgi:hypothetical protein
MPGEALGVLNGEDIRVVASDHFTDEIAVCLCTTRRAPFFVVVGVNLESGHMSMETPRCANIGTAIGLYHQYGGTVNDLGLDGDEPARWDELEAQATRDTMQA